MRQLTLLVLLLFLVIVRRGDAQGMVVHGKDIQQRATNPAVLAGTRIVRAGRADTLGQNDSVRLRPGVVVAIPTGKGTTRDSTAGPPEPAPAGPSPYVHLPGQADGSTLSDGGRGYWRGRVQAQGEGDRDGGAAARGQIFR